MTEIRITNPHASDDAASDARVAELAGTRFTRHANEVMSKRLIARMLRKGSDRQMYEKLFAGASGVKPGKRFGPD